MRKYTWHVQTGASANQKPNPQAFYQSTRSLVITGQHNVDYTNLTTTGKPGPARGSVGTNQSTVGVVQMTLAIRGNWEDPGCRRPTTGLVVACRMSCRNWTTREMNWGKTCERELCRCQTNKRSRTTTMWWTRLGWNILR